MPPNEWTGSLARDAVAHGSAVRLRTARAALTAGVLGLAVAVGYDAWYRSTLVVRERERVRAQMAPHAQALENAIGRRVSRLIGLKDFVEAQPSLDALNRTFNTFAAGLRVAAPGIRALQLNRSGRIIATEPMSDASRLLGYDLLQDPRAEIADGVRRAMSSSSVVVTGPIELLQGGQGLLIRRRLDEGPPGFPDLVSMAVDVKPLLDEASAIAPMLRLRVALLDRARQPLRGSPIGLGDPATVSVSIMDGEWTLLGMPVDGWNSAVSRELRPTRVASAVILLLVMCVTYLFFGRQARLEDAVEERTRDLERANDDLRKEVQERERVEQQLRLNDERLQIALMSGKMGLWGYDPIAGVIEWSEQSLELLGLAGEARVMTGDRFIELIPAALRDMVREGIAKAMLGRPAHAEYTVSKADGSTRWLYVTGTPLTDGVGPGAIPSRIIGVLADITERRLLEEQLLHSQKMEAVGTLAGGIAHDFNNLLTAMMGFAQLADQQASTLVHDDAPLALRNGLRDVRTELIEIMKAGERAAMLTSQLLAFSRRQRVTPTEVDVNVAVHDIERMLQRLIGERLTLTTRTVGQPLPVMVDAGQLAQVLVNLVVNARDAMPNGGMVQVSTDLLDLAAVGDGAYAGVPAGAWVVLTVQDSGTGMTPEVQARIFEPFYTTKAIGDGTGLGMSTVYGIVQQAGGRLLVDSTLGVGTAVRVLLPRLAARSLPVGAPPAVERPTSELILVVEDEPGLRRLVAEILNRRGFRVRVAADGIEALEVLDGDRALPSLVITDVVMPRLGGRGLAETMTARGILVPVLFMSGYQAGEELPDDATHAFVPKPFTPDTLVTKVRQLLERERATV
ncbi:ATP-binding protein [Gemmatimonas groenlandica]|uniref:histidine kinase n=1 Tax=Gemmatimonas groenlandica TaxID=2732249 RepID=A0A6M4IR22_9BACT|nr:ATP-binding protein [Gemmatimonas groenlandica]QJR35292.1 response regulator [Gemmatimonas groenlandica]